MGRGHCKETKNPMLVKTTTGTSTRVHNRKSNPMHKTFKIQTSIPKQSRPLLVSQAKIPGKNQTRTFHKVLLQKGSRLM